eukprot:scaffold4365_cov70-Phaeocystis_antarctica.AAC.2
MHWRHGTSTPRAAMFRSPQSTTCLPSARAAPIRAARASRKASLRSSLDPSGSSPVECAYTLKRTKAPWSGSGLLAVVGAQAARLGVERFVLEGRGGARHGEAFAGERGDAIETLLRAGPERVPPRDRVRRERVLFAGRHPLGRQLLLCDLDLLQAEEVDLVPVEVRFERTVVVLDVLERSLPACDVPGGEQQWHR